jgi:hypothetical protein
MSNEKNDGSNKWILKWLDTVFKNSGVQHFDMFKLRIFRIYSADIVFLYFLIFLLSNYISFSNR